MSRKLTVLLFTTTVSHIIALLVLAPSTSDSTGSEIGIMIDMIVNTICALLSFSWNDQRYFIVCFCFNTCISRWLRLEIESNRIAHSDMPQQSQQSLPSRGSTGTLTIDTSDTEIVRNISKELQETQKLLPQESVQNVPVKPIKE